MAERRQVTEVEKIEFLRQSRESLKDFAANCLRVRDKAGNIVPLIFNDAQLAVHDMLEKQRAEKGWVRAIILKGRQQGISTYIAARFYWRAALRRGVNVYILSHEQPASDALFGMVERYQRHNPVAPHIGTSNVKELVFDRLDSSYTVATAGNKEGGRSRTVSLFHGSEVAFWTNAPGHFASSVQAVPLLPGTEVILESTSAGVGGEYYERYQDAEAGRGDYMAVFLPWFLSPEYSRAPEPGFELSAEADDGEMSEQEYAATFGLSLAQMAWRRNKIIELRSAETFKREYPANAAEAWTAPNGHEPYISPVSVLRARKRSVTGTGPLILGVDPASMGGDRFSVAARRGFEVQWVRHRNKIDHLEGTQWIRSLIDELQPARVNVDAGNIGHAIVTGLKSIGPKYTEIVRGVNFGGTAEQKLAKPKVPGPANRRAEMWQRLRDWLMLEEGVSIPDDDALQTDMTSPRLKPKLNNDFLLESKDEMRKRHVRSPDLADAVALTFAFSEYITNYAEQSAKPQFGDIDASRHSVITHTDLSGAPTGWMG